MSNENKHGISHVTPVDANIFEELGFDHAEAADLLIRAQLELALEKRIEAKRLMLVLEKDIKSEKFKRSRGSSWRFQAGGF